MDKQIDFWREVHNSYGVTFHAVLKSFLVPDDIPEEEAESGAINDFCAWAHVDSWNNLAHGYDIRRGTEVRHVTVMH